MIYDHVSSKYMACAVVPAKTAGGGDCQVAVQPEKSFEELANDLTRDYGVQIDSATLAKVITPPQSGGLDGCEQP